MAQPMPVIITYGTVSVGGCRYVDGDNEFSGVLAATYLLMNGLLNRTPRGRTATEAAYRHLGLM